MENHKTAPSLYELQLWMKWIVTDPRGVRDALTDPFPSDRPYLERYTSPDKNALYWVADDRSLDASNRLEIYAEAYFTRLLDSMKSDFPITFRVLGEVSFQKLISDYLKKHPSKTTNIGEIGKNLPNFISNYDDLNEAPFLAPLAEMEWFMIESFYAQNTRFLNPSILSSVSDEDLAVAEFKLAPFVYLIESEWTLDQFSKWRNESLKIDERYFEPLTERKGYLICRENGHVMVEELSAPGLFILHKLKSGENLISTLEHAQNIFFDFDIGSKIMTWFNEWVRRGIIYDVAVKSEKVNL